MFNRLAVFTIAISILTAAPAYAGQWLQDSNGWWWQNDDGSYPAQRWMWLDGNNDGMSEHYYFDSDGYVLTNAITPDGQQVNGEGAWVIDGAVQMVEAEWVERNTVAIPMTEEEYEQFVDRVNRMKDKGAGHGGNINETNIKDEANILEEIDPYELACRVIELINIEREQRGKNALDMDDDLMENAMIRAEEASVYFSHMRPDGSNYDTAITVEYTKASENLAGLGYLNANTVDDFAKKAVDGWLNSSGHKKNLLDSEWKETGVGVYITDSGYTVIQLFIK